MVTELEKRIYNCWLAHTGKRNNRPFRMRKQWKGFEDKKEYIIVKKLANMFIRYDNIDIDDFFDAPYEVYNDTTPHQFQFYTTMKVMTVYKIYCKKKYNLTDKQFIDKIKKKS